jgi:uncharacterized membrane protein YoaK (UPF0700 family)
MKMQRIVIFGGCSLAFGASFANTGLVLHTGISVSHLTGDIAKMTMDLARWSPAMLLDVGRVGVAAACFLLGAILAGVVIHHPNLDISRPYGRTITGIGVLFLIAYLVVGRYPLVSIGLSAFGCGLQNSLAAHYRGIVLRTTHLTGMFTDFGVTLGMRLRGHDIAIWKVAVPLALIASFFCGGICAATAHFAGYDAIALAGVGYMISGIGWSIWKRNHRDLHV